jgi:hypothetical protein
MWASNEVFFFVVVGLSSNSHRSSATLDSTVLEHWKKVAGTQAEEHLSRDSPPHNSSTCVRFRGSEGDSEQMWVHLLKMFVLCSAINFLCVPGQAMDYTPPMPSGNWQIGVGGFRKPPRGCLGAWEGQCLLLQAMPAQLSGLGVWNWRQERDDLWHMQNTATMMTFYRS